MKDHVMVGGRKIVNIFPQFRAVNPVGGRGASLGTRVGPQGLRTAHAGHANQGPGGGGEMFRDPMLLSIFLKDDKNKNTYKR